MKKNNPKASVSDKWKTIVVGLILVSLSLIQISLYESFFGHQAELAQCQSDLSVAEENYDRLNFKERFDRCSVNPYTNQIICDVCIMGKCVEVHEWDKNNDDK